MIEQYGAKVAKLKETIEAFEAAAEGGREGRGCKTRSLEARKLSMTLTEELKEFRAISIQNDKSN